MQGYPKKIRKLITEYGAKAYEIELGHALVIGTSIAAICTTALPA